MDNSTLTGYVASKDFLDFAGSAWGTNNKFGQALPTADGVDGLTADTGTTLENVDFNAAGLTSATGTAVNAVSVAPGGSIAGSTAAPTDLIILNTGNFLNAAAVAGNIAGGAYTLTHSADVTAVDYNFLLAYAGTDGFAHIADLHILGSGAGGATSTATETVAVSDMVTLVGVTLNTLAANVGHVHLVA